MVKKLLPPQSGNKEQKKYKYAILSRKKKHVINYNNYLYIFLFNKMS